MNRLIQDLSTKAWDYAYDHDTVNGEVVICDGINMNFSDLFIEKYTELIVRECVKEIELQYGGGSDQPMDNEWDRAIECVSSMVKYRFGVEE